jgi:predicted lactoylglutathione lyase
MADIKDSTKKTTRSLMGGLLSLLRGSNNDSEVLGKNSSDSEVLGGIYKLMVQKENFNKLEHERRTNYLEEEEIEQARRHAEILKALSVRRKPAPKKVKAKEPVVPGMPKAPTPKAPAPAPTPAPTPKAPAPAPKAPAPAPTAAPTPTPRAAAPAPAPTAPARPPAPTPPPAPPPKAPAPTPPPAPPPKAPAPSAPAQVRPATTAQTGVQTATKVATTTVITSAALLGKESLAANIAKYESTGSSGRSFGGNEYNAYNKGTVGNKMIPADKPIDFSKMTISEYLRRGSLSVDDPDRLFAVGRYQIIPKTMKGLIKALKIDPETTYLTQDIQDMLFARGLTTSVQGRGAVEAYLKGKPGATRDAAILALSMEFASVGVPYDIPKNSLFNNKLPHVDLKRGQSFYSGIGGNKAHNSPDEVALALDADREKNLKLLENQQQVRNLGNQIDQSSKENVQLKKELNVNNKPQQTTNNINVVQPPASKPENRPVVDDSSAYSRKTKQ